MLYTTEHNDLMPTWCHQKRSMSNIFSFHYNDALRIPDLSLTTLISLRNTETARKAFFLWKKEQPICFWGTGLGIAAAGEIQCCPQYSTRESTPVSPRPTA